MAKFRKKPVVIEAWPAYALIHAATSNWDALPAQIAASYEQGGWVFGSDGIDIPTLEGVMHAESTDMIIQGVSGEFYPCKPDIFGKTYEAAE